MHYFYCADVDVSLIKFIIPLRSGYILCTLCCTKIQRRALDTNRGQMRVMNAETHGDLNIMTLQVSNIMLQGIADAHSTAPGCVDQGMDVLAEADNTRHSLTP